MSLTLDASVSTMKTLEEGQYQVIWVLSGEQARQGEMEAEAPTIVRSGVWMLGIARVDTEYP